MAEFKLEIITPYRAIYNGDVQSVTIPGTMGSFQVLHNHAPMIATFEVGAVKIVDAAGQTKYFATAGGTAEVLNNHVLVLADSLEAVEEIDVERAKKAAERAKERLANRTAPGTDIERAERALKRSLNRLDLVGKYLRGDVVKEPLH